MDKYEELLSETLRRKRPFAVPRGYFAGLRARVEDSLPPAPETKAAAVRHPGRYAAAAAAACAACAVIAGAAYMAAERHGGAAVAKVQTAEQTEKARQADMDAAADYAMLDKDHAYAYIAGY